MNPSTARTLEFVWRRLEEPPEWFGHPLNFDPRWWFGIGAAVLIVALAFASWVYGRERRSLGRGWATLLLVLRSAAMVTVFVVWLLPAMRQVEFSEQQSRVALLFDVSASVAQTSDAPPTDAPGDLRVTRQETLAELFRASGPKTTPSAGANDPEDFATRLLRKNPLVAYRFGEFLDSTSWLIGKPEKAGLPDWTHRLRPTPRPELDDLLPTDLWAEFRKAARQVGTDTDRPPERAADLVERWERALGEGRTRVERLLGRTNLGGALRDLLRKEPSGTLQGVIVFSDGHATAGSDQDLNEAIALAKKDRVPIFTVGLGQYHPVPNLRLADTLAPNRIQPEDDFPVRVAIEGEQLTGPTDAKVVLSIEKPGKPPETREQTVSLTPGAQRQARGAAEFRLTNPEKIKGTWKLQARVVPLKGERTRADNQAEEPTLVQVEDRKLSVLLVAAAPMKEYQFLRTMLVREPDKFDLAIYLQSAQQGTVQDIDPKRLLEKFPSELRDRDADPNNLGNYDVIVAFDPDWKQIVGLAEPGRTSAQDNLKRWVEQLGGGLIVVAGPVHTFALARAPELATLRQLYPVELDDTASSIIVLDRSAKEPYPLNWDALAAQMPFFDLQDTEDKTATLAGWEAFFEPTRNPDTGLSDSPSVRGFYAIFPLRDAKPGAQILARYADPDRKFLTPTGQRQPFFVLGKVGKGPVFYIGSGETYRLRAFSEKFHERFWTKLIRHMGKREASRGLLVVGSRFAEGDTAVVEAELYDAELKPLEVPAGKDTGVVLRVKPPPGVVDVPKEWAEGLAMAAQPGRPGWFQVRVPLKSSGKYGLELQIPGSSEKLTGGFRVEAADPERDDVRPHFALLHRLANPISDVQLLDERKRPEFLAAVQKSREVMLRTTRETATENLLTAENDQARLFFDLDAAPWIAECLDSNIVRYRTEGKVMDLWDKGLTVLNHLDDPEAAGGPPWALTLLVLFLGTEWLVRKLLRVA
jgi:hypothetical protein